MIEEFCERLKTKLQEYEAGQYKKLGLDSSGKIISPILGTSINAIVRDGNNLKSNYQHLDNPGIYQAYIYYFLVNELVQLKSQATAADELKVKAAFSELLGKIEIFINNSSHSSEPSIKELGVVIAKLYSSYVKRPPCPAPKPT